MVDPQKDKDSQSNSEEQAPKFGGKLERGKSGWVRACPQCLSINLRPLASISGILEQAEWACQDCGFVGISIEVQAEDLEELHRIQLAEALSLERRAVRGKGWNFSNRKRRQKD
ncbi:MAG: hypothetical protein ACFFDP_12140 [Promethearchaeota archaeon]